MEFSNSPYMVETSYQFSTKTEVDFPAPPKRRTKERTALPSYLTSAKPSSDTFLPQTDLRLALTDFETFRTSAANTAGVLRKFAKASPDLSAAIYAANRLAVSKGYLVLARNLDGTLNIEGTQLVQQLCRRFDLLGPSDGGYNSFPSIRSASESMGLELSLLGALGLEVVLNKARLPEGVQPISTQPIKWKYNGKKKVPYQVVGADEISLDVPTFIYVSLDQDLTDPYSTSPVQSAIPPILATQTFAQDLRRVFRRAVHPRVRAKINEEMWKKSIPDHVSADPDKFREYMSRTLLDIQALLDNLEPEDALVNFDTVDIDYLTGGYTSMSDEYKTYQDMLNGQTSSGVKSVPVVLGYDATGSTNIASTQSMLFVKAIEGAIQTKLNEAWSRALTISIRLFGVDAVVEFSFNEIDLRPASELESFRAVRQSRILEQLSIGQIDDNEASLLLTGSLPPPGAPKLSGTFFKVGQVDTNNPDSNTSALNRTLKSDSPAGVKSQK